ncbi:MAG: M20/M25/M40 family metallo-hydrolase [Thermodesulfobacteriota bacterium]|jgi:acetylornithine deacetylase/succinyl-diaminopimelate desuccinylase-like protein
MDKLKESVFSHIEAHREEMVLFLKKLIQIDTQTPPGLNYDRVCEVLADKFRGLGCEVQIHNASEKYLKLQGAEIMGLKGPRSNVVARYRGQKGKPVLHASAHIDTAAIQAEGWTVDPLGGDVTKDNPYGRSAFDRGGGYIWGRGANDDKGEMVSLLFALQALHDLGIKLEGDLIVTGNCDEEIGGITGLGFLIQEGIIKADFGLQWDGSLTGIGLAAQGRTRFLIRTVGKSYHGQVPILGVNAIEKMSKINVALTDYWRNVLLKRQRPIPGIELPDPVREAGVDNLTAMLNIGTIKGGIQGATVPDQCEEEVLRGMVPGETIEEVKKELISVIEGVKATDADLKYEVEVINFREGYVVSPQDPYVLEGREIIKEVIGQELPFTGTLASTDMNFQVNDGRMPCFNLGVGGAYGNTHKQDESVSIDELVDLTKITALLYMRKLGAS